MSSMRIFAAALVAILGAAPSMAQSRPTPPAPAGPSTTRPPAPAGQAQPPSRPSAPASAVPGQPPVGVETPPGFIIGPDDVLTIVFWRDKDISGDVIVRPDGMISLPLINEVKAAGLAPDQLRVELEKQAARFIEDTNCVVVVKQINSRKVYITGMVNKIGAYPLTGPTTVLQLITMAGGLMDFADQENITILRETKGVQQAFRFNYKEVMKRKKLTQNIPLQPGDTVVVP
jgi:polysaccharide biosynthesis/export protein